jgi:D-alanyl-D-alanine carboxypeptidase
MRHALAALILIAAAPVQAQLCDNSNATFGADGRALGHLPYGDAPDGELARLRSDMAVNGCTLRRDVLPDVERLLTAAAGDPAVQGRILALSCHRSIERQQSVFCRERDTDAGDRAISVAPPGHSEHATGYALDFAFRPRVNGCPDAETCIAATPAYRWLVANAPRFGFEQSFPVGNRQKVKWEPWHWRWVGANASVPGAARARALFARARRDFPAMPAVDAQPVTITTVTPPPFVARFGAIPAPECRKGKCRVARRKR